MQIKFGLYKINEIRGIVTDHLTSKIIFKIYKTNPFLVQILQNQEIKFKKMNMQLLIIDFGNINWSIKSNKIKNIN